MFFFFFQFFFFFFPSPAMRSQKEQTPARGLKVCHYVYDRTHLRGSYLAARGRASLGCRVGMETKCLALAAAGRRKHTRCLTKVPRYGISNMALRWPATRDKDSRGTTKTRRHPGEGREHLSVHTTAGGLLLDALPHSGPSQLALASGVFLKLTFPKPHFQIGRASCRERV